jgi:hypothetical protein
LLARPAATSRTETCVAKACKTEAQGLPVQWLAEVAADQLEPTYTTVLDVLVIDSQKYICAQLCLQETWHVVSNGQPADRQHGLTA